MSRTVTMEIEGIDQVIAAMHRLGADAEHGLGEAVTKTALVINQDVKRAIKSGAKTGVKYWRIPGEDGMMRIYAGNPNAYGPSKLVAVFKAEGKQNLSKTHQASAPGEAPASDTGTLVSSIYFEQNTPYQTTIGSRLAYAEWLEFGTRKIAPRPAWVPAVEKHRATLQKLVMAELKKATENAQR